MSRLHVLRVFVGKGGTGGNPLGVFLEGHEIPRSERQEIAADLGFSETVFVEDVDRGDLRIYTPAVELTFAGHPLVGTGWLLARAGAQAPVLLPPAGEVPVRSEDDVTYIRGRAEWAPPFALVEFDSPAAVDQLAGPPGGRDLVGAWAWEDEEAGRVRARVFPVRLGINEDEATGAHAVLLSARLERDIEIHQGEGSVILARPQPDGTVEIGGRTELVEVRQYN